MNQEQSALWKKLEAYEFDASGSAFPFSAKLAKENGWSVGYTNRAIDEYRKFLFLAIHAGHPISPSEAVDQVWHMHMVYTEDYWKRLCGETLGRPFHHNPSRGGADESAKFEDWYARTLESYRIYFGRPPGDIWPDPLTRKHSREDFVRVDRSRAWIIPKPRIRIPTLGLAALALMTAGCAGLNPLELRGPEFLGFYLVFAGIVFGIAIYVKTGLRAPYDGPAVSDLDPFEVAYLNEGKVLAINTAMAGLVQKDRIEVLGKEPRIKSRSISLDGLYPLEKEIVNRTIGDRGVRLGDLRRVLERFVEPIHDKLEKRGLLVSGGDPRTTLIPFAIAMIVPVVGWVKIAAGVSRVRPVEILIFLSIIALIGAFAVLFKPMHRSRYGDKVLDQYRLQKGKPSRATQNESDFLYGVAAYGLVGLAGTEFAALQTALRPPPNSSSACGGGCSGGGGGGCSGGGCGGCGGGD